MKQHEPLEKYKLELKDLGTEAPGGYKKIGCPSCNSEVPADNININDKIAKCNDCDVVFPFHAEVSAFLQPGKIKQEVIRPEGIDIFHFEDDLDFTIQQPLTALEVLSVGFLPTFALLFTLIYFKVGISIFWPGLLWMLSIYTIIGLSNRSKHKIHLNIDDRTLTIKWRPRKLNKDQSYPIDEIDQIYAKSGAGHCAVYMIVNGIDGQKHIRLISGLDSLSKARYLEQEIERHLGIPDRPIPEEST